jgi:hypothetical protein
MFSTNTPTYDESHGKMKQTSDKPEKAIRQLSDKLAEIIIAHYFNYCFVFEASCWLVEANPTMIDPRQL